MIKMSKHDYTESIDALEAAVQKRDELSNSAQTEMADALSCLNDALESLTSRAQIGVDAGADLSQAALGAVTSMRSFSEDRESQERESEGRLESARARIQELEQEVQGGDTVHARLAEAEKEVE